MTPALLPVTHVEPCMEMLVSAAARVVVIPVPTAITLSVVTVCHAVSNSEIAKTVIIMIASNVGMVV